VVSWKVCDISLYKIHFFVRYLYKYKFLYIPRFRVYKSLLFITHTRLLNLIRRDIIYAVDTVSLRFLIINEVISVRPFSSRCSSVINLFTPYIHPLFFVSVTFWPYVEYSHWPLCNIRMSRVWAPITMVLQSVRSQKVWVSSSGLWHNFHNFLSFRPAILKSWKSYRGIWGVKRLYSIRLEMRKRRASHVTHIILRCVSVIHFWN
jgi:hypothetical protein